MAKTKDEPAAVKRALERFNGLTAEDKQMVLSRIEDGEPEMGLVDMAYVEETYADLSDASKSYLLAMMKQNAPKAE